MVAWQSMGGLDSQGPEFLEKSSLESGMVEGGVGRTPCECSPGAAASSRLPSGDLPLLTDRCSLLAASVFWEQLTNFPGAFRAVAEGPC